jgi:hypothetical protein
VIRRTNFCAAAEIRVSEWVRNERQTIIATVGLSFLRYRELLGTPYAGATYISYPTAVGAAILGWHTLCHVRAEPCTYSGRSHRRGLRWTPIFGQWGALLKV